VGKEGDGSDDRVDGGETMANGLGRAPLGRSDTEATRERDGSDYKVLGESSVGKERDGSDDGLDGRETVGNSLGRAPTTGWTLGKSWEIAWGELRGEGGRWKRRQGGRKGNCGK